MPYLQLSPGANLPARQRIADKSTRDLRADAQQYEIDREERQATRDDELRELQKADQAEARYNDLRMSAISQGLEVPDYGDGYNAPNRTEQIRDLETQLSEQLRDRPGQEFSQQARSYGVKEDEVPDWITTDKGRAAYLGVAKAEQTGRRQTLKEETEQGKKNELIVGFLGDNVGKTFNRGTANEYTLDTPEEAIKVAESRGLKLSQALINQIYSFPWPADGVNELGAPTELSRQATATGAGLKTTGVDAAGRKTYGPPAKPRNFIYRDINGDLYQIDPATGLKKLYVKGPAKKPKETKDRSEIRRLKSDAIKAGLGELEGSTLAEIRKDWSKKMATADVKEKEDAVISWILAPGESDREKNKRFKKFQKANFYYTDQGLNVARIEKVAKSRLGTK